MIEKHFTLDKKLRGPDHICSYNPKEFRSYVHDIRAAEVSLGEEKKKLSPIEKKNVKIMRRSIHSNKLILKGEKLNLKNLVFLRPNDGIPVKNLNRVLNKKALKNIQPFSRINLKDIK